MQYTEAFDLIDAIIKKHNPCNITIVDGVARCRGVDNNFKPCCAGCKFLGASGCTVKSLSCKFYLCSSAYLALPDKAKDEVRHFLDKIPTSMLKFRHDGAEIKNPFDMLGHFPRNIYG